MYHVGPCELVVKITSHTQEILAKSLWCFSSRLLNFLYHVIRDIPASSHLDWLNLLQEDMS